MKTAFKTVLLPAMLLAHCLLINPTLSAESPAADLVSAAATDLAIATDNNPKLTLQREQYRAANEALARGDRPGYRANVAGLADYPLLSYLEYRDIGARLAELPQAEVDRFLANYPDTYLAGRLEREWVAVLARQERWADVVRYHNTDNSNTELTCHALRARLATGDVSAFADVAPLWNVARSQPDVCDPVFAAWLAADQLTPELAWQRFSSSIRFRQLSLARFIARQMPARERALADTFLKVDRNPELLRDTAQFAARDPELQEIVQHGLQRLAQEDAPMALALLPHYDSHVAFDANQRLALQRYMLQRMLQQGRVAETETLLLNAPELISDSLAEWLLRDALKQQDWQRLDTWLARLSTAARQTERWQYWQARVLERRGTPEAIAAARATYQALAQLRSYYGFLAADLLGMDYVLVDRPLVVAPEQLQQLAQQPALRRAQELYLLGEEINAQFEWDHATAAMQPDQIIAAGKLAESWGWYRNGIQAMIRASYWDDLQVRFPLAYEEYVARAAEEHAMTSHFLFAIARQESAFMQDARSSAGALGLMQLMPGTAQDTARSAGMRITSADLMEPEINIALGSRYLAKLLQDFNGNRILAAAAYNAGPNRVRQWLSQEGSNSLPYDIWIETIPFAETRGYVQNVLAYAVIYGYRMEDALPFVTAEEASRLL